MLRAVAAALLAVALTDCSGSSRRALSTAPTRTTAATVVSLPPSSTSTTTPTSAAPTLSPPHVLLVIMENREFSSVIGSASAPYINGLAGRFGLATVAFAATHPSLPNYLDLIAGTTFGINSDCTGCSVEGPVLADQLDGAGVSWAAYAEGMPSPCYQGPSAADGYAKKHNPWVYVRHLVASASCGRVRPFTSFAADVGGRSPPAFVWVSPNLCHDGHDCSTETADSWLRSFIDPVLGSAWYAAGGVIIVTWDEGGSPAGCCGSAAGGHVATLVISGHTRPGATMATPVDHAGVLRTIEDLYGVGYIGDAACTCSGSLAPLLS